ncbi:ribosomal protein S5 domain 2-type protein [Mycena metata]|uniref:Ribosomal RNA-processing protein 43 n=1 Tax=Mycena metata TaxID=1033252 RepID=A0AAD7K0M6_9AGAR|nr:ribosomal protein S5 domain 2-type protein [Mycena metata]
MADSALKASIFQRLHPRAYLERFVAESVRPDGRPFDAWRDVSVNVGSISTANGSALVRLGETTIVCGVKAEIAEPELDAPDQGFLVPNIDLPALCSPKFKPGPPSDEAQVLSDRLNEVLSSYQHITSENGLTTCSRTASSPLQMLKTPVSFSFGVFDATLLADPTAFEEPLLDTTISVVVDENGDLVSVVQLGPGVDTGAADTLSTCISSAKTRRVVLGGQIP